MSEFENKKGSVKMNIRGKRSKIALVPDSKEYYRGIKVILWYWFNFVDLIKNKLK